MALSAAAPGLCTASSSAEGIRTGNVSVVRPTCTPSPHGGQPHPFHVCFLLGRGCHRASCPIFSSSPSLTNSRISRRLNILVIAAGPSTVNLIAGLTAYTWQAKKPSLHLSDPRHGLLAGPNLTPNAGYLGKASFLPVLQSSRQRSRHTTSRSNGSSAANSSM